MTALDQCTLSAHRAITAARDYANRTTEAAQDARRYARLLFIEALDNPTDEETQQRAVDAQNAAARAERAAQVARAAMVEASALYAYNASSAQLDNSRKALDASAHGAHKAPTVPAWIALINWLGK